MNARQKAKYYKQKYERLSKVLVPKERSIIEIRRIDVHPYAVKAYLDPDLPDGYIERTLAEQFLPAIRENMQIKRYEGDPIFTEAPNRCLFTAALYIGKFEENM